MASAVEEADSGGIQFVGSTYLRKSSVLSSAQTLTLSGIQSGDVVFFSHVSDGTNRSTLESNTSDLSSWTLLIPDTFLTDAGQIASTGAPGKSIYYKVATGTSESINFTYIPTGDPQEYLCVMFAVRGLNTTTPVVAPKMFLNSSLGTTLTAAARDNPSYNTYNVVWHFHDDDEDAVLGQPSGYTEIIQQRSNTDTNDTGTLAISYIATTGNGSLGDRVFTTTQSDAGILIDAYLVPSGEDGTPPTITGSSEVKAAAGGTAGARTAGPHGVEGRGAAGRHYQYRLGERGQALARVGRLRCGEGWLSQCDPVPGDGVGPRYPRECHRRGIGA